MNKKQILLSLTVFTLIVVSLLSYQQFRRNQLVSYLSSIDQLFNNLEAVQKLSMEANKAGMSNDFAKEAEINQQIVKLSAELIAPFHEVDVPSKAIKQFHEMLLQLNQSTHELLIYRIEVLGAIKDGNLSPDERKAKIETFWSMQDTNQKLYRQLGDALHKYAKRQGVKVSDHLKNFII